MASRINHLNDRLNLYILKNDLLGCIAPRYRPTLARIEEEDTFSQIEATTAYKLSEPSNERISHITIDNKDTDQV